MSETDHVEAFDLGSSPPRVKKGKICLILPFRYKQPKNLVCYDIENLKFPGFTRPRVLGSKYHAVYELFRKLRRFRTPCPPLQFGIRNVDLDDLALFRHKEIFVLGLIVQMKANLVFFPVADELENDCILWEGLEEYRGAIPPNSIKERKQRTNNSLNIFPFF
ncbi:hypothetical protein DSECCO2_501960 [anaerobic digester metagenome]